MKEGLQISQFAEFEGDDPMNGFHVSPQDRERLDRQEPILVTTSEFLGGARDEFKTEYQLHAGDYIRVRTSKRYIQGILLNAVGGSVRIVQIFEEPGKTAKYRRMYTMNRSTIKDISKMEK